MRSWLRKISTSLFVPFAYLPADEARGEGIVGFVEDDMVVGMDGAFLPEGTLEGKRRQRCEMRLLFREEGGIGFFLRGSVELHPDLVPAPVEGPLVGFIDVFEGPSGKQVFAHGRHSALHFSFVPGHHHLRRVGDKTEEPLHIGIRPVHGGIVDVGLQDT